MSPRLDKCQHRVIKTFRKLGIEGTFPTLNTVAPNIPRLTAPLTRCPPETGNTGEHVLFASVSCDPRPEGPATTGGGGGCGFAAVGSLWAGRLQKHMVRATAESPASGLQPRGLCRVCPRCWAGSGSPLGDAESPETVDTVSLCFPPHHLPCHQLSPLSVWGIAKNCSKLT